ncbi:GET complex subunit get1 [Elasticomyces elasticus]|nr:hypothetical protein LTR28_010050 [Elasticomyces elasticus]KAK4979525.1 GET complex subunit get1 [Elasticomyces elasticus]KAK4988834.1 GET complex subunit get1 [Elasticomyces elasticus]
MGSLLLTVFLLQLVIHLINTIGATALNELLWVLYNKFPAPTANAAHDTTRLKGEVLRLKKELNAVSAQDNFTKWAKLRRQHDKAVADYEKSSSSIQASRTKFNTTVTTVRWLLTNGLRFFLQFWYARTPMFWLPQGWVPGYIEWALAFPKAPTGSISIQVWGIACASVVVMAGEAVVATYALTTGKETQGKEKQEQAMPSSGGNKGL